MRTLICITAAVLLAWPPSLSAQINPRRTVGNVRPIAQTTPRTYTTGTVSTSNLAGTTGSTVITHEPGNNAMLYGLLFMEREDDPCHMYSFWWSTNASTGEPDWVTEELNVCRNNREGNTSSGEYVGIGDNDIVSHYPWSTNLPSPHLGGTWHAADGLQVCDNERNENNIKLKGLRLLGSTVDRDSNGMSRHDNALTDSFERPNCRHWTPAQSCAPGKVIVGLRIHVRDDSDDHPSVTGFNLRCASVTAQGG